MVTRNRRTRLILTPGYVTKKEFNDMQADLKEQLDKQRKLQKKTLMELKKITTQLAGDEYDEDENEVDEDEEDEE